VIAVDGRNIISGKKSHLRPDERMYILPPHGSGTYEGWRTDRDTVNRFYFHRPGDSYAAAFGDTSAMGVVAVAVYREKEIRWPRSPGEPGAEQCSCAPGGAPEAESAGPRAAAPQRKSDDAGPASGGASLARGPRGVRAETRVAERHFLKYEWRETLCRKAVIDCRWSKNRFWDDDGYAPYPRAAPGKVLQHIQVLRGAPIGARLRFRPSGRNVRGTAFGKRPNRPDREIDPLLMDTLAEGRMDRAGCVRAPGRKRRGASDERHGKAKSVLDDPLIPRAAGDCLMRRNAGNGRRGGTGIGPVSASAA